MIKSTTDYDMFKFRDDNRSVISQAHLHTITESIRRKNLLSLRPISVNEEMEVFDGQTRLLAAKALGVPIYYEVNKSLKDQDLLVMNLNKAWNTADYFNYYTIHKYPEYLKLQEFMKKYHLELRVAFNFIAGRQHEGFRKFRDGTFKFTLDEDSVDFDTVWQTIDYIKKMNGTSSYLMSAKFWKAITRLVIQVNFDKKHWFDNLAKLVERVGVRPTYKEYAKTIMDIYNYRLKENKVDLIKEDKL